MINFNEIEFETSFGTSKQIFKSDCLEFVFAGRSNVGKSSFINKLFNRKKLARVSSSPGKTITINFYKTDRVRFVDLPGYGYAKVSKIEQARLKKLINEYFSGNRKIALVFLMMDIRRNPSIDDISMVNLIVNLKIPFTVILTKIDKIAKTKLDKQAEFVKSFVPYASQIIFVQSSAETGQGLEEIKEIVRGQL